jgi:hypothetical protein
MAAESKRLFVYIFIAIILFVRDVVGQNCVTTCTELTSCASCIIGADPKTKPLQLMQKPEFILPTQSIYTLEYPCNISCKWNRLRQACSDSPLSDAMDDPNFVYPLEPGQGDFLRFDLYVRMGSSVYCESSTGNSHHGPRTRATHTARCSRISRRANTHGCHSISSICALPDGFFSLLRTMPEIHAVMFHPCNFFQHLISTSFSTVYNSRIYCLQDITFPNRS